MRWGRSSGIARAGRAAERAVIGAVAGLILSVLALMLASQRFHVVTFREPAASDPLFWIVVGIGGVTTAGLAVAGGEATFSDRTGSILGGMACGAVCGLAGGAMMGWCLPVPKAGVALGIFLGGPAGAVLGGVLGFENNRLAQRQKSILNGRDGPEHRKSPADLRELPDRRDAGP